MAATKEAECASICISNMAKVHITRSEAAELLEAHKLKAELGLAYQDPLEGAVVLWNDEHGGCHLGQVQRTVIFPPIAPGPAHLDRVVLLLHNREALLCSALSDEQVAGQPLQHLSAAVAELMQQQETHPLKLGTAEQVLQIAGKLAQLQSCLLPLQQLHQLLTPQQNLPSYFLSLLPAAAALPPGDHPQHLQALSSKAAAASVAIGLPVLKCQRALLLLQNVLAPEVQLSLQEQEGFPCEVVVDAAAGTNGMAPGAGEGTAPVANGWTVSAAGGRDQQQQQQEGRGCLERRGDARTPSAAAAATGATQKAGEVLQPLRDHELPPHLRSNQLKDHQHQQQQQPALAKQCSGSKAEANSIEGCKSAAGGDLGKRDSRGREAPNSAGRPQEKKRRGDPDLGSKPRSRSRGRSGGSGRGRDGDRERRRERDGERDRERKRDRERDMVGDRSKGAGSERAHYRDEERAAAGQSDRGRSSRERNSSRRAEGSGRSYRNKSPGRGRGKPPSRSRSPSRARSGAAREAAARLERAKQREGGHTASPAAAAEAAAGEAETRNRGEGAGLGAGGSRGGEAASGQAQAELADEWRPESRQQMTDEIVQADASELGGGATSAAAPGVADPATLIGQLVELIVEDGPPLQGTVVGYDPNTREHFVVTEYGTASQSNAEPVPLLDNPHAYVVLGQQPGFEIPTTAPGSTAAPAAATIQQSPAATPAAAAATAGYSSPTGIECAHHAAPPSHPSAPPQQQQQLQQTGLGACPASLSGEHHAGATEAPNPAAVAVSEAMRPSTGLLELLPPELEPVAAAAAPARKRSASASLGGIPAPEGGTEDRLLQKKRSRVGDVTAASVGGSKKGELGQGEPGLQDMLVDVEEGEVGEDGDVEDGEIPPSPPQAAAADPEVKEATTGARQQQLELERQRSLQQQDSLPHQVELPLGTVVVQSRPASSPVAYRALERKSTSAQRDYRDDLSEAALLNMFLACCQTTVDDSPQRQAALLLSAVPVTLLQLPKSLKPRGGSKEEVEAVKTLLYKRRGKVFVRCDKSGVQDSHGECVRLVPGFLQGVLEHGFLRKRAREVGEELGRDLGKQLQRVKEGKRQVGLDQEAFKSAVQAVPELVLYQELYRVPQQFAADILAGTLQVRHEGASTSRRSSRSCKWYVLPRGSKIVNEPVFESLLRQTTLVVPTAAAVLAAKVQQPSSTAATESAAAARLKKTSKPEAAAAAGTPMSASPLRRAKAVAPAQGTGVVREVPKAAVEEAHIKEGLDVRAAAAAAGAPMPALQPSQAEAVTPAQATGAAAGSAHEREEAASKVAASAGGQEQPEPLAPGFEGSRKRPEVDDVAQSHEHQFQPKQYGFACLQQQQQHQEQQWLLEQLEGQGDKEEGQHRQQQQQQTMHFGKDSHLPAGNNGAGEAANAAAAASAAAVDCPPLAAPVLSVPPAGAIEGLRQLIKQMLWAPRSRGKLMLSDIGSALIKELPMLRDYRKGNLSDSLRDWGLLDEFSILREGTAKYLIPKAPGDTDSGQHGSKSGWEQSEGTDLRAVIQQQQLQRASSVKQQQRGGEGAQEAPQADDLHVQLQQQGLYGFGVWQQGQPHQHGAADGGLHGHHVDQQQLQQEEAVLESSGPSAGLQLLHSIVLHEQLREQGGGQPQQQQQQEGHGGGDVQRAPGDVGPEGIAGAAAAAAAATGARLSVWERLELTGAIQQQQPQQQHGDHGDAELAGIAALVNQEEGEWMAGGGSGLGRMESDRLQQHQEQGGCQRQSRNPVEQRDADAMDSEAIIAPLGTEAEEELGGQGVAPSGLLQQQQQQQPEQQSEQQLQHASRQGAEGLGDAVVQPERPPKHLVEELRRNILRQMSLMPGGFVKLQSAADPGQLCPRELTQFKLLGPRFKETFLEHWGLANHFNVDDGYIHPKSSRERKQYKREQLQQQRQTGIHTAVPRLNEQQQEPQEGEGIQGRLSGTPPSMGDAEGHLQANYIPLQPPQQQQQQVFPEQQGGMGVEKETGLLAVLDEEHLGEHRQEQQQQHVHAPSYGGVGRRMSASASGAGPGDQVSPGEDCNPQYWSAYQRHSLDEPGGSGGYGDGGPGAAAAFAQGDRLGGGYEDNQGGQQFETWQDELRVIIRKALSRSGGRCQLGAIGGQLTPSLKAVKGPASLTALVQNAGVFDEFQMVLERGNPYITYRRS